LKTTLVLTGDATVLDWLGCTREALFRNAAGQFQMSRTVMFDITHMKQAETTRVKAIELEAQNAQLIETGQLKDQFLANMSHELHTPLNAVVGLAQLREAGVVKPESPKFKP
jgi:signal transduction histidine kinase